MGFGRKVNASMGSAVDVGACGMGRHGGYRLLLPAALALVLAVAGPAAAQKAPDAGTILREQRQSVPDLSPPPALGTPLTPPASAPLRKGGGTVHVTDIHVNAGLFPEATLKELVKDAIGKDATLGDLQELAARIGAFYLQHDILARAYLPSQSLDNGEVTINVIEARLGQIIIDPSSRTRLPVDSVQGFIHREQAEGETFHLDAAEAGVANLMTVPGMTVVATIAPGAQPGQSDMVLKLDEGPLVSGTSLVDNDASRAVGTWRWVGAASLNDALGIGDQLAVTLSASEASRLGVLRGDVPVGYSGLRAGIEFASLDYRTLRSFNASQPKGGAVSAAAFVSHPLWRGEDNSADGRLGYYHKRLFSTVQNTSGGNNVIDEEVLTLSGLARDDLLGGGVIQFNVMVVGGSLDLGPVSDSDAAVRGVAKTQGPFARVNGSLSRTQPLIPDLAAVLRLSGQAAAKNLDGSEQFSLGGPDQIRAYPLGEAAGDAGWQLTGELRQSLTEDLQLVAFWDGGQIVQHVHPWAGWQGGGNAHNLYFLQGAGLATGWRPLSWLSLEGSASHRIGPNPGVSASGRDADGLRERWRGWARLAVNF